MTYQSRYGHFAEGGRQYVITAPRTPARWFNYLFNDDYYMEVGETGQGSSTALKPQHWTFTRGFRYFYLVDQETGDIWCPLYQPLRTLTEIYTCTHSLGYTEIRSRHHEIEASVRIFVPAKGKQEVWTVTLTNHSNRLRRLSLFSVFSLENAGGMGSKCDYDDQTQLLLCFSFPYHVAYEEKEKCDAHASWAYVYSDRQADSWDCSQRRFFGGDDVHELPAAVLNGCCSGRQSEAEQPVGAFQHSFQLNPGGSETTRFVIGCAGSPEDARETRRELTQTGYGALESEAESRWNEVCEAFLVETPDGNLNAFMNYWLKKQIVLQTRTNRMSNYCPIRNQLQDAMGYAMVDPQGAAGYMLSVLKGQERSGFIKQWIMTDDSPPKYLCRLSHTDGPLWLLICLTALIHQSGSLKLLHHRIRFKDSEETASVYEHLLLAIEYMSRNTGAHGLCLMGDGDWNDPINGPGRLGRGESAWNSMALVYGIRTLLPICRLMGDERSASHLEIVADRFDDAINRTCWDGKWYVAGFDDSGIPFGTAQDKEGSLFLNTQTWAIMSGIACGERLELCLQAIDSLNTSCGPLLLKPAFSEWNPKWGRVSVKLAGTTENGSVYCHASMFKAFADCTVGRGSEALETVLRTLPTNPDNPPEVNLQAPIFVPNYYFGLAQSPNFGQSSHHHSTGTVGWMMWVVLEYMLGIRATAQGLRIEPCIPPGWAEYRVERNFRNARYLVTVLQGTGHSEKQVFVDGRECKNAELPYEDGKSYRVEVYLGPRL